MTNLDLFQVLASEDQAEQERLSGNRAIIAVQTRVKTKFEKFVRAAKTDEEHQTRIELVSNEIQQIANEAADEYHYDDVPRLINAATAVLGGGHASDCTCGFCENKGKLPGSSDEDDGEEKESSFKTAFDYPDVGGSLETEQANDFGGPIGVALDEATKGDNDEELGGPIGENASGQKGAKVLDLRDEEVQQRFAGGFTSCSCGCEGCDDGNHCESEKCIESKHSKVSADVETGDTYTQERVDLPAADNLGLGGPSPKIDKGKSGDNTGWNLDPIEVPSKRHPKEDQALGQDYPDYGADLPGPSETGKQISADSPLQPEFNVAPNTDTWSGTEGLATPVTSAVLAKWTVVE